VTWLQLFVEKKKVGAASDEDRGKIAKEELSLECKTIES